MHQEKLESHLRSIEPRALFSILLGRSAEYSLDTLEKVSLELERREITLDSVIDQFEIRCDDKPVEIEDHKHVGRLFDEEKSIWDTLSINNYLQEHLTIQKGHDFWIIQHVGSGDSVLTFGIDDSTSVKTLVRKFLSLEDWEPAKENRFTFEDWETVLNTTSLYYIEGLTVQLKGAKIPFLLKLVQAVSADPLFVASPVQERQALLIPGEYLDAYNELMSALEIRKTELIAQLEELEEADDLKGQLGVYQQLDHLTLIDSYIFYNKGGVLFELDRFDEAADAVILSINLDLDLGQLSSAYEAIRFLTEILAKTPKNIDILHCLAHLETQRDNLDIARKYYQKILVIDENNAIANLHLGYFYFENSQMHSLALKHLNKYLEVAESEEERKVVEDLLNQ